MFKCKNVNNFCKKYINTIIWSKCFKFETSRKYGNILQIDATKYRYPKKYYIHVFIRAAPYVDNIVV